ncbi:MAG TPA: hypothetical protein DFR83_16915, partial [Deltaproteobacteria bacterium]|nr:hypothetical protein [Deltaproteobacteria bacterium]
MKRVFPLLVTAACSTDPGSKSASTGPELGPAVTDVTAQALGCFSLHLLESGRDAGWLGVTETGIITVSSPDDAARFTFQP